MRRVLSLFVLAVAVGVAGSFSPLAAQEDTGPETVTMDRSRTGVVTFGHAAHQEYTECSDCHHEAREGMTMEAEQQACGDCHTDEPEAPVMTTRADIFHVDRAESGVCVDCHVAAAEEGKDVPERCRDCHVRGGDLEQDHPLPALLAYFLNR